MYSTDFRRLALWIATLPLLTINVCYAFAIALDHLPVCVPYVSGCTSVSSTGRFTPESLIFKAGMIPSAAILLFLWCRCASFLEYLGETRSRFITLRILGVIAASSLILYSMTLGLRGDEYRLLRRVGIDGFAISNFAAQVLFVVAYRHRRSRTTENLWRSMIALCVALPALGIAAEIAKWVGAPKDVANNIVAWNAFVVLCAYYAAISGLRSRHDIRSSSL